jgi:hypothetical protein
VTTDRYRHRPVEIEALRWNPGSLVDAARVVGPLLREGVNFRHPSGDGATTTLLIDTPEGEQVAQPGDWIVRPAGGDWAVMPAADFAERYELAAAPSAPADRAALRVEIAEALMRWAERNNDPQYAAMRRSETVRANAYGRADAVLAVLPEPADRPVILREAAERVTGHAADHFPDEYDDYADQLAAELRRMAGEAQQPTPCSARPCNPNADELCDTHAQIKYHAEGEHAFCEPGCDDEAQQPETQADCPHCPDGHTLPTRGSQPWSAWVDSARDGDGQPMQIIVARSAGAHVAESDAQWMRDVLNGRADASAQELPLDHPLRRQCRCSEAGVCRTCSERPSAAVSQPGKEPTS